MGSLKMRGEAREECVCERGERERDWEGESVWYSPSQPIHLQLRSMAMWVLVTAHDGKPQVNYVRLISHQTTSHHGWVKENFVLVAQHHGEMSHWKLASIHIRGKTAQSAAVTV